MPREDIVGGLRNAVARGYSLEQAKNSFITAGYSKEEVEEAVEFLHSGSVHRVSAKPAIIQSANLPQPTKPIQPKQVTQLEQIQQQIQQSSSQPQKPPEQTAQLMQPQLTQTSSSQLTQPATPTPLTRKRFGLKIILLVVALLILIAVFILTLVFREKIIELFG